MRSMTSPRPFIPYDIPLGEGERARLVLPQDLTVTEAGRLCGVIRTLAFTDAELAAAEDEITAQRTARQESARSLGALMAEWAAAGNEDAHSAPTREDQGRG